MASTLLPTTQMFDLRKHVHSSHNHTAACSPHHTVRSPKPHCQQPKRQSLQTKPRSSQLQTTEGNRHMVFSARATLGAGVAGGGWTLRPGCPLGDVLHLPGPPLWPCYTFIQTDRLPSFCIVCFAVGRVYFITFCIFSFVDYQGPLACD